MFKGVDYRGIAVTNGSVFAGDADGNLAAGRADFVGKIAPLCPGLAFVPQIDSVLDFKQPGDFEIESVVSEHCRYRVNAGGVGQRDDPFKRDVAVHAYLLADFFGDGAGCPAGDDVRLNTALHKLFDSQLCCL